MPENFDDRLLASTLKLDGDRGDDHGRDQAIFQSRHGAARSSFSSSQVFAYSIMINSHGCIAQNAMPELDWLDTSEWKSPRSWLLSGFITGDLTGR